MSLRIADRTVYLGGPLTHEEAKTALDAIVNKEVDHIFVENAEALVDVKNIRQILLDQLKQPTIELTLYATSNESSLPPQLRADNDFKQQNKPPWLQHRKRKW
jgi:hypothetical protein